MITISPDQLGAEFANTILDLSPWPVAARLALTVVPNVHAWAALTSSTRFLRSLTSSSSMSSYFGGFWRNLEPCFEIDHLIGTAPFSLQAMAANAERRIVDEGQKHMLIERSLQTRGKRGDIMTGSSTIIVGSGWAKDRELE